MTEKKNFWQTVPGVITGLATILTAAAGLIPLFMNNDKEPEPQVTQSSSPTPTPSGSASSGSESSTSFGSSSSDNPAPKAVVAPKSLDFGQIGSGKSRELTVTVANGGDEYLVVDGVSVSGRNDVFAADGQECLGNQTGIEPDGECEIKVKFTPTAPGAFAGFLEIKHSAKDSPTQVALNGEGVLLDL
jgi:hypothetical protein